MSKVESITFKSFMSGEYQKHILEVREIKKHKIYKVVLVTGLTLIVFLTGFDFTTFAAGSGIDAGAQVFYKKLLSVGKWIIVGKGAIDTINSMLQGDHAAAKKGFLTYVVVYTILNGLPWALNEVDVAFSGM